MASEELLAAYHDLYELWWLHTATMELDVKGYNGISYDETEALDEAAARIQHLLGEERPGPAVGQPPPPDL